MFHVEVPVRVPLLILPWQSWPHANNNKQHNFARWTLAFVQNVQSSDNVPTKMCKCKQSYFGAHYLYKHASKKFFPCQHSRKDGKFNREHAKWRCSCPGLNMTTWQCFPTRFLNGKPGLNQLEHYLPFQGLILRSGPRRCTWQLPHPVASKMTTPNQHLRWNDGRNVFDKLHLYNGLHCIEK